MSRVTEEELMETEWWFVAQTKKRFLEFETQVIVMEASAISLRTQITELTVQLAALRAALGNEVSIAAQEVTLASFEAKRKPRPRRLTTADI